MSGNDSAISVRESREERFEDSHLIKMAHIQREPIILLGSRAFTASISGWSITAVREQVLGLCEEAFATSHQGVHCARFLGERVEDAELRWTHLQCVPSCGSGFSLHQW